MRIISLGAGVQSSTMALMAAVGEFEMPDCAIFADTGWEPRAVYEWLDWLEQELPYPLHRVSKGTLREDLIKGVNVKGYRFAAVPFFTGNGGMGKRQCTYDYKIQPVTKKLRELGYGVKKHVALWMGISLDETHRMRPNRTKWIHNTYPLIDRRMNRRDCINWMTAHGYPVPPRSSCLGCPFHGDDAWRGLKERDGAEWEDTVYMDSVIRVQLQFKGKQYMHRSLVPLGEVDLRSDYDMGQQDLFGNECEGMCGT